MFSRSANPALLPRAENKPKAFLLYSRRQAIEEGSFFIVLQTYPTYSTVWKIARLEGGTEDGDSKKARMKLARGGGACAFSASAGRRSCATNWR